ncbi:MAG: DUF3261 domain-containing protein [Gammaproteobacteria bacterium]|nr:DUF3261 domain-containing protein [Gammaproteobacteria bacterium]
MKKIWLVVPLFALLGCAGVRPLDACTSLGAAGYCLQANGPTLAAAQSVELSSADSKARFIVHLETDANGMRMVGLTPLGQRVWLIRFDYAGKEISADMPAGGGVDARQILAGLQLALWPLPQARAGLQGANAQLRETDGMRQLLAGDAVVFSASCDGQRPTCRRARLRYLDLGYELAIETLD